MKHLISFAALIGFFFISCGSSESQKPQDSVKKKDSDSVQAKTVRVSPEEEIRGQLNSYKITLVSFNDDSKKSVIPDMVKKTVFPHVTSESIVLDSLQRQQLFPFFDTSSQNCTSTAVADCYEPHHAMLFYGKNGAMLGYIEICFMCDRIVNQLSKPFCSGKIGELKTFFKSCGIKKELEH